VGSWEEEGFTFLFFVRPCPETVAHLQAAQPGLELLDDYCLSYADWQGEPLAPFTAGPIRVVPAWAAAADAPGGMQLRLHPGLVFGAGTHPTTRSCIEALGRLLARYPAERALDLGCGTGVLALAMARLGCRRVLAVDTNLLAVRTTRRNVRLNRLETQVLAVQGRAEDYFHGPAQLVVANLHFDAMMGMLTAPLPAQRRWLVLSGLLRSQTEAVCRHLARLGTCVVERISPDGIWTTLIAAHGGACP
jgi:ribosomal protein L11 methyltransferase